MLIFFREGFLGIGGNAELDDLTGGLDDAAAGVLELVGAAVVAFLSVLEFVAHFRMGLGEVGHAVYHHLRGSDDLLLVADLLHVGPGDGYHPEERH